MSEQEKRTSHQIRGLVLNASLGIMEEMAKIREDELALRGWNVQIGATFEPDEIPVIDTTYMTPRPWSRMLLSEVAKGYVLVLRGVHELATVDAVVDELQVVAEAWPGVFADSDIPTCADEVARLHDPAVFLEFAKTIKIRTALFRKHVRNTPKGERDPLSKEHVRELNTFCDWNLKLAHENVLPQKFGPSETVKVLDLVSNAFEHHIDQLTDRDEIVHAMQMKDPVLILVEEISAAFTHCNAVKAYDDRSREFVPEL